MILYRFSRNALNLPQILIAMDFACHKNSFLHFLYKTLMENLPPAQNYFFLHRVIWIYDLPVKRAAASGLLSNCTKYHAFMPQKGCTETQNGHFVVKFLCIIFHF